MRFSRLVSLISLTIFCALGLVIVSSWATRHAIINGQRFSVGVRKSVLALAEFPSQSKSLLTLIDNYSPPKGVSNIYSNYLEVQAAPSGLAGSLLISSISSNGENTLLLINLSNKVSRAIDVSKNKDQTIQYRDYLIGSESKRISSFSSRNRVSHPYLSKDGTITYSIPWNDLVSFDLKTGREKWRVRGAFHHSIETDANGNIWVCGAIEPETISNKKIKIHHCNNFFEDQALVQVSPSGKIL